MSKVFLVAVGEELNHAEAVNGNLWGRKSECCHGCF